MPWKQIWILVPIFPQRKKHGVELGLQTTPWAWGKRWRQKVTLGPQQMAGALGAILGFRDGSI